MEPGRSLESGASCTVENDVVAAGEAGVIPHGAPEQLREIFGESGHGHTVVCQLRLVLPRDVNTTVGEGLAEPGELRRAWIRRGGGRACRVQASSRA